MGFGRILNVVSGLLSVQDLGLYHLLCVRFFSQIHFLCVLMDFGFFIVHFCAGGCVCLGWLDWVFSISGVVSISGLCVGTKPEVENQIHFQ